MRQTTLRQQKSMELVMPMKSLAAAQRLVAYVETAGYALLHRRTLSTTRSPIWKLPMRFDRNDSQEAPRLRSRRQSA